MAVAIFASKIKDSTLSRALDRNGSRESTGQSNKIYSINNSPLSSINQNNHQQRWTYRDFLGEPLTPAKRY